MLKTFVADFTRSFYSPRALYSEISEGRKSKSWLCVVTYCLLYVVGALWLYFNGITPSEAPWIVLRREIYYLVEAFYILPLILLMWILGTGVIHVLGRLWGANGSFDVLFDMTGYSLWAPWYPLFVVDCIRSVPPWLYEIAVALCLAMVVLGTTVAARVEEELSWARSATAALLAVASIGVFLFTFIR